MTKEIDSIVVAADTVITEQSLPFDSFYEAVSLFSADHPHYKLTHGQLVDTLRDYSSHWLLGKIEKARRSHQKSDDPRHRRELSMLPDSIDYGHIEFIRQGAFYFGSKHHNEVTFEEWTLKDAHSAERWLFFLKDHLTGSFWTKPPRFQWVEGSKLYLVTTRSASQWHSLADSLIMKLSGKTKRQMWNIYDPIDLVRFKKWQQSSHSSVTNTKPYWHKESNGPHFSYFYFTKHYKKSNEYVDPRDFHITTSLHGPLVGNEKYETIKETLVQIQCAISEPELKRLNIVNKHIEEVETSFGSPLYEKEDVVIFGHSNRIIAVKMAQKKVSVFKYIRLSKPFEAFINHKDLIDGLFSEHSQRIEQNYLKADITLMYDKLPNSIKEYMNVSSGDTLHYFARWDNPYVRVYQLKFNKAAKSAVIKQMTVESYKNHSLLEKTTIRPRKLNYPRFESMDTYVQAEEDLVKVTIQYKKEKISLAQEFVFYIIPDLKSGPETTKTD